MECYVANNSFRSILNYSRKHPYYIMCQVIKSGNEKEYTELSLFCQKKDIHTGGKYI